MLNLPDKPSQTDEELRQAMLKLGVDPALMRDLKDVLALHGAGSAERQTKARMTRMQAQINQVSLVLLAPILGLIALILILSLFGMLQQLGINLP